MTDFNDNADPTPPTFDEQLEGVFAARFAQENADADNDLADAPTTDEPATGAEGASDPVDAAGSAADDRAVDPALAAGPAPSGGGPDTLTPGPVDFDPATFGVGGEPDAETPPAAGPAVLSVPLPDGGAFELDVQTAESLLALGAWSQNLRPDVREAFAAIEQGQAVAVDRQDYERFVAWTQTQGNDNGYDDLDPAVVQRLAALEAENDRLRGAPLAQQYSAQADQATAAFVDAANAYRAERGLTEAEMLDVYQRALSAGVVGPFAESMRTYSPSGVLLRDADYGEVARRAFDFAIVQDPALHSRVLAAAADANPAAQLGASPGSASVEPDPTAIKKARAGSLASAPSAAVAAPPVDPRVMSPADRQAAMAAEISAAMRQ